MQNGEETAESASRRGRAISLGLCAAVAAFVTLYGLGTRPLLDAEARYALVSREMLTSGDWIQPRLNTLPYYEKPPLLNWAIGASYRALGVDELASRVPSALAHVGTTLLVWALARRMGLGAGGSLVAARTTGVGWADAFALGALMNSRGLMELIALNVGYELGILSPAIFAMMVLMALVTTFATGPLLSLADRWRRAPSADGRRQRVVMQGDQGP